MAKALALSEENSPAEEERGKSPHTAAPRCASSRSIRSSSPSSRDSSPAATSGFSLAGSIPVGCWIWSASLSRGLPSMWSRRIPIARSLTLSLRLSWAVPCWPGCSWLRRSSPSPTLCLFFASGERLAGVFGSDSAPAAGAARSERGALGAPNPALPVRGFHLGRGAPACPPLLRAGERSGIAGPPADPPSAATGLGRKLALRFQIR